MLVSIGPKLDSEATAGRDGLVTGGRPAPESVDPEDLWRDLSAVGIAISERVDSKGRHGMETRYYILSRLVTVREFATAVRGHWGIENNLHWQLDVSFREDECRVCRDHGPANLRSRSKISVPYLCSVPMIIP